MTIPALHILCSQIEKTVIAEHPPQLPVDTLGGTKQKSSTETATWMMFTLMVPGSCTFYM